MLSRFLEGLGLKRSEGAEKEELRELSPAAQYEKEELGRYLERIESANPQSYLQFVERVKTFKVNLWPYERKMLTPLECARYGWKCIPDQANALICSGCLKVTVLAPPPPFTAEALWRNLELNILRQIKCNHESDCPWIHNPTPKSFAHLSKDNEKTLHDFKRRFKSFAMTDDTVEMEIIDEALIALLKRLAENHAQILEYTPNEKCKLELEGKSIKMSTEVIWAISGFSVESVKDSILTLACRHCLKKVDFVTERKKDGDLSSSRESLKLKKRKMSDEGSSTITESKTLSEMHGNPLKAHSHFCPWITELGYVNVMDALSTSNCIE